MWRGWGGAVGVGFVFVSGRSKVFSRNVGIGVLWYWVELDLRSEGRIGVG